MQFTGPDGITLTSREPLVKAAMFHLADVWPRAVPFAELRARARARVSPGGGPDGAQVAADAQALGQALLTFYGAAGGSLVELHTHLPAFAVEAGERPVASPLARLQAAGKNRVTNLRHESVTLDDFQRHTLRHLDGSRARADLLSALTALAQNGELTVEQDGKPVRGPDGLKAVLGQALDRELPWLGRQALLLG